jgi:hypothetical protein
MADIHAVYRVPAAGRPAVLDIRGRRGALRPGGPVGTEPIFSPADTTAGAEMELQAAVEGRKNDVDLPLTIERSNYLANVMRRAAAGDAPRKLAAELGRFLEENDRNVWENSWVRFPRAALNPFALEVLRLDLRADKGDEASAPRADAHKFSFTEAGTEFLRVPVSYLVKLALADAVGTDDIHPVVRRTGTRLLDHFLSDNTSPETYSFYIVRGDRSEGPGKGLAREAAKRYLLTQLLVMYANAKFGLAESGQKAVIYLSPHPPIRQKKLAACISDSFYREIFMSPCLSGWDKGEAKQDYMRLCHEVLSRSQLNAVAKLHDAGIITSNLVVLPTMSNISLANNGTHVSLGSLTLTRLRSDGASGFGLWQEKQTGDLATKIMEHFLPLFVKTYSAAPYRLDFADFHAERVLGFLPHELDYTHLRMLWRRWKAKASIRLCGRPVTPIGPPLIDGAMSRLLRLKGDFVPDFRLIDYLVGLLSTERSPALSGYPGNGDDLKKDLADLGVFDTRMSLYLPLKLREFDRVGFCGFEARHYSLFPSIREDMAPAVDLQNLITAFAYRCAAEEGVSHADIPDSPFVESERRQVFFGAAIGIPTFFVHRDTPNRFLRAVVEKCGHVRASHRYPGYLRVYHREYCAALVRLLETEAADLVELFDAVGTLEDLKGRLADSLDRQAAGSLTKDITQGLGVRSPLRVKGETFNGAAEDFYRNPLRLRHMSEALDLLEEDLASLARPSSPDHSTVGRLLYGLLSGEPVDYLRAVRREVVDETAPLHEVRRLIHAALLTIAPDLYRSRQPHAFIRETGT